MRWRRCIPATMRRASSKAASTPAAPTTNTTIGLETAFWTDSTRSRVRLVQCDWVERGTWWRATYTKSGLLAKPQKCKFKDRKGKSASGLILQSSYINRENMRYGMVRGLISLQDEINKRRSKALHLLSVRQVVAEQGAVQDVDKARREIAKPDGYVEVMPGLKFEVQESSDLASGQFQLLQHATAEMQLSGPNAAMSGTDPRELSGRAILARHSRAGGAAQNRATGRCAAVLVTARADESCFRMAARGSSGPPASGCAGDRRPE